MATRNRFGEKSITNLDTSVKFTTQQLNVSDTSSLNRINASSLELYNPIQAANSIGDLLQLRQSFSAEATGSRIKLGGGGGGVPHMAGIIGKHTGSGQTELQFQTDNFAGFTHNLQTKMVLSKDGNLDLAGYFKSTPGTGAGVNPGDNQIVGPFLAADGSIIFKSKFGGAAVKTHTLAGV